MKYIRVQMLEFGRPIGHRSNKLIEEAVKGMKEGAKVRYLSGMTISLGDFNSARVEIGIELPCGSSMEEIQQGYEQASKWVDDNLEQEVASLLELKKSMGGGKK